MERDVPDHHRLRDRVRQDVGAFETDACHPGTQAVDTALVDVDGRQGAAKDSEFGGQSAVAGADLEDAALGRRDERDDPGDRRRVDEEVLAEFMSATGG